MKNNKRNYFSINDLNIALTKIKKSGIEPTKIIVSDVQYQEMFYWCYFGKDPKEWVEDLINKKLKISGIELEIIIIKDNECYCC